MPVFDPLSLLPVVFAALVLVWASLEDAQSLVIPNAVPLAMVGAFAVHAAAHLGFGDLVDAVTVAAVLLVAAIVLFSFGWFGGGDGKLIAAVGLWAGPALVADFLIVTALAGGVLALLMVTPAGSALGASARRLGAGGVAEILSGRRLPYGVAIACGGWTVLAHVAGQ